MTLPQHSSGSALFVCQSLYWQSIWCILGSGTANKKNQINYMKYFNMFNSLLVANPWGCLYHIFLNEVSASVDVGVTSGT